MGFFTVRLGALDTAGTGVEKVWLQISPQSLSSWDGVLVTTIHHNTSIYV
jgi:hypothetical protein